MSDETQNDAVLTEVPAIRFLRNRQVPTVYSPLIDVRTSQQGVHLLSYVAPAAAPADVELLDGQPVINVLAQAELLVPLEGVERLIRDLCSQYKATLVNRLRRDAEAAGMTVPPDEELHFAGLEDIWAVGRQRPESKA